jgi:hypothetical protein
VKEDRANYLNKKPLEINRPKITRGLYDFNLVYLGKFSIGLGKLIIHYKGVKLCQFSHVRQGYTIKFRRIGHKIRLLRYLQQSLIAIDFFKGWMSNSFFEANRNYPAEKLINIEFFYKIFRIGAKKCPRGILLIFWNIVMG